MANISVSLPADGETIDASDYNTPINTIVNEINGNLDNSNIDAAAAIAGSKLADAGVTPAKRSGGFFQGTITSGDLGTTGDKVITGVGFTPKRVEFVLLPTDASATTIYFANGAMDADGRQYYTWVSQATGSGSNSRGFGTDAAMGFAAPGTTTRTNQFAFVSMDADGFTINVSIASGSFAVRYLALG